MFDVQHRGETEPGVPGDARWALVQRIVASHGFRSSPRLRDFLLYAAECTLHDHPEEVTEQQIGMKVFGRPAGYNSSEDSIVRSHARLLRQKLATYFEIEGARETLRLELPKGRYLVVFSSALATAGMQSSPITPPKVMALLPPETVAPVTQTAPAATTVATPRSRRRLAWLLPLLAGAALGTVVFWLVSLARAPRLDRSVAALWQPFLHGEPPLLIYSNGIFIGDSKTGMRYAKSAELEDPAAQKTLVDHYTGIGEAAGVYELTRLFDTAHASFILKRSHLVTWDEAKLRNLIFIGSPAENLAVQALPADTEFTLVSAGGISGYRNNHPRTGEQTNYARPDVGMTRDYALVSFLPGMQSGKQMILLSGLTTLGTQAAVEFASRPEGASTLLKAAQDAKGRILPFEALLETTIVGGVPLETQLLTIHVRR